MKHALVVMMSLWMVACGDTEVPPEEDPKNTGGKGDIIGTDDRRDEFSEDVSDELRELGRSTAMIIQNEIITDEVEGGRVRLSNQPLGEQYYLCPDERFWEQPVTGMCSAWLVAPDIVVTNGHCVTSQPDCDTKSFVFDFTMKTPEDNLSFVPQDTIYACDRVLAWDYSNDCDVDFAVIKLSRPVTDRPVLSVRQPGETLKDDDLVIIGHPFGIPRKYALEGEVLIDGTNTFTTTHDIIGGNSGSAIFDVASGEVQGLVTCGGSNFNWQYWNEGWRLDVKTGKACNQTCDDFGEYVDGSWEPECVNGERRRCACDGTQLVWEKRGCLSFENETQGQCTREFTTTEDNCRNAPWLCAPATMQHTQHFAHFIGEWSVFSDSNPLEIAAGEEQSATIQIEDSGRAQALSVYLDFRAGDEFFDGYGHSYDLTITLEHASGAEYVLNAQGELNLGTTYPLGNVPTLMTQPFEVPFMIPGHLGEPIGGEWTLKVSNQGFNTRTLHGWSIQATTRPASGGVAPYQMPCVEDCVSSAAAWPDPIIETFEGSAQDIAEEFVSGRLMEGWSVEIMDENGQDYEVFKSRKSQTLSLTTGEFAISRDFGEDLSGRALTLDYRYDGEGWFQVWADGHIVYSVNSFNQATDVITLPEGARTLKFVLGATDGSRAHELTLYSLTISPPAY